MNKLKLDRITIACVDCYNYGGAVAALKKSMEQCDFAKVKFFTDIKIDVEGVEVIQIPRISSKPEYSRFVIKELWKHVDTEFVLIVQHDGFVICSEAWSDDFYTVDGLGAAWLYQDQRNNFNGGFCLMSKKLLNVLGNDTFIEIVSPDDEIIGRLYRNYLIEKHGIKFPTDEMCDRFAFELRGPVGKTFGFHGNFHPPYKPHILLKRSGAGGDIVLMEPVMRWYNDNGWQVVLDVPLQFFELYTQHDFLVKHVSQLDNGRIKPEKMVNLDLSYEVMPHQNYVKSYFDVCGIKNYKLAKPQLFPRSNNETKLFQKFAVVHIDRRETKERNVYGIKWSVIQEYLEDRGYAVIQISKNESEKCGTWINTSSIAMMKYVISSCDIFLGIDSMPSNIAIAYNKPCVLFFGSVDPNRIHVDLSNVEIIQGECDKAGCWHIEGGTAGKECFYKETDKYLQCCTHGEVNSQHNTDTVIDRIKKLI